MKFKSEKWMQSKPNPYMKSNSVKRMVPVKMVRDPKRSPKYGMPVNLFKDSDKDGVMNVFDCQPYNKKKQDVVSPVGDTLQAMYARREAFRQQGLYDKYLRQLQDENARLAEQQRLDVMQPVEQTPQPSLYVKVVEQKPWQGKQILSNVKISPQTTTVATKPTIIKSTTKGVSDIKVTPAGYEAPSVDRVPRVENVVITRAPTVIKQGTSSATPIVKPQSSVNKVTSFISKIIKGGK